MTGRMFFRSRRWRLVRWVGLGAALPVLWACNARTLETPKIMPTNSTTNTFQETVNRKIDILFMIDNSSSMSTSQKNLAKNLPAFMDVLKTLPDGAPDLHIAVVTSDMGAGDGSITDCSGNGDNGVFQSKPTGGCTNTNLQQGQTYISAPLGGTPNFSGDITAVFQCIAQTGENGCGFEHQLQSVARSLGADGASPPQENQGFIRPEAYLAIIFVTNEDDCSAPRVDSVLYDTTNNLNLASPVGPPGNFRCNEFGHLCSMNGGPLMPPSRLAPGNNGSAQVPYTDCVSAEDKGMLTPVATFVQQIKGLKGDPASQILVAAIIGQPTPTMPYTVHWKPAPVSDTGPWPEIVHSCGSEADTVIGFADPAIRIAQFVAGFAGNGLTYPFCTGNYAPALQTIAQKLSALIAPSCITGTVAMRPNTSTPDCTVTEISPDPNDGTKHISTPIPACADNGGASPCWTLDAGMGGAGGCPMGTFVANIKRTGQAPDNTRKEVQCAKCIPGIADATRGCP